VVCFFGDPSRYHEDPQPQHCLSKFSDSESSQFIHSFQEIIVLDYVQLEAAFKRSFTYRFQLIMSATGALIRFSASFFLMCTWQSVVNKPHQTVKQSWHSPLDVVACLHVVTTET